MNAVGVFLVFGACMAALAGTTLVWQGTALDRLWVLNKSAYMQLAPIGRLVGTLFSRAKHHFCSCCSGLVQTPRLGMGIGCWNHFHAGGRRPHKPCKGRLSAGCHGRYDCGRIVV